MAAMTEQAEVEANLAMYNNSLVILCTAAFNV